MVEQATVEIRRLPPDRWEDYRRLRLEALERDPRAFGSSSEDEARFSEEEWRKRILNTLFATSGERLVGMLACIFNEEVKTRHVAYIAGFYVTRKYRGKGVGKLLLEEGLAVASKRKGTVKVKLAVNPEQEAAVRLYRSVGFVVTGRTKKELKVDGIFCDMLFMEKML